MNLQYQTAVVVVINPTDFVSQI